MEKEYKIDYDMFSVLEICKIIEFFRLVESTKHKRVNKEILVQKYREYQNILRNKSLEKKYDTMLFEKSGISYYSLMKNLL